jgi:hypothetical protein
VQLLFFLQENIGVAKEHMYYLVDKRGEEKTKLET